MNRSLSAIAIATSLSACSAQPPAAANQAATVPVGSLGGVEPSPAATLPAGLPESAAPHAAPPLQPVVHEDLADKNLLGSGCAFRAVAGGPMLLTLRDEGDGVAKFGGHLRRLVAATPGRDAIMGGAIIAGDGASFTVTRTADAPGTTDGTIRAWPASLDMRTADGGERIYRDGRWECGR